MASNEFPENIVLLIIDVQQGFNDPVWGNRNNPNAEENIARLLDYWRRNEMPVFHVQHLSMHSDSPLAAGSPGCALKEFVTPREGERLFQKNVNSAFIGTDLESQLRENDYDTLVIVGLTTPHCISTTARMAGNLGFRVYVVSDATAAFDMRGLDGGIIPAEEIHRVSLATINDEFAAIVETASLLKALK